MKPKRIADSRQFQEGSCSSLGALLNSRFRKHVESQLVRDWRSILTLPVFLLLFLTGCEISQPGRNTMPPGNASSTSGEVGVRSNPSPSGVSLEWLVGQWELQSTKDFGGRSRALEDLKSFCVFPYIDFARTYPTGIMSLPAQVYYYTESGERAIIYENEPIFIEIKSVTSERTNMSLFVGSASAYHFSIVRESRGTNQMLVFLLDTRGFKYELHYRKTSDNPGKPDKSGQFDSEFPKADEIEMYEKAYWKRRGVNDRSSALNPSRASQENQPSKAAP